MRFRPSEKIFTGLLCCAMKLEGTETYDHETIVLVKRDKKIKMDYKIVDILDEAGLPCRRFLEACELNTLH